MAVSVSISVNPIDRLVSELADIPGKLKGALWQSINRTTKAGARLAVDEIARQNPTLKASKLMSDKGGYKRKRPIVWNVASGTVPSGNITINDSPIPARSFKVNVSKRSGVTMQLPKGPVKLRHAFRAKMKSGYIGIFDRYSPKSKKVSNRLPISEKFGPNVYTLANVDEVKKRTEAALLGLLDKNVQSQIDRFLKPKSS